MPSLCVKCRTPLILRRNLPREVLLMEQHAKLSHCLPTILEWAEKAKAGSGFLVKVNGKVEQIYP